MISVIVPVYNAENTLRRCVDSILSQEYMDLEVLLVNDGSVDQSLLLCEQYAQADRRIRVFDKPNGGVSSARNLGIDNAQGEWITFVDSDDYIGPNYFDVLMSGSNEDFVLYNFQCFNQNQSWCPEDQLPLSLCLNKREMDIYLADNLSVMGLLSPFAKFFKKQLLGSQRFLLEQCLGEDTIFVHQYLRKCSSMRVSDASIYHYYDISTDFCKKYNMSVADAIRQLYNIYCGYVSLGITNQKFVAFELELFRKTCANEIFEDSRQWYCDKKVQEIYHACSDYLGRKGFIKYSCFRVPFVYRRLAKYLK